MANYDIKLLQQHILRILEGVDECCKKNDLRYFIIAGTLLGAVRHKGFIPWDDDIDIAMPRPDYDRLIAHASEFLPAPLEMVCYENDTTYPLPFAKIQDGSTTLIERAHLKYLGGIYIDVFPLDGMTSCPVKRSLHFMRYEYYKKLLYFICRDPFKHGHGPSCWIPLLCRFFYTLSGIQRKMSRMQKAYEYDKSTLVVDHDDGLRGVTEKSIFGTPSPYVFAEKSFLGVEMADKYLSNKYGDYMQIPKAANQHQHNFDYLDLEHSYREFDDKNAGTK